MPLYIHLFIHLSIAIIIGYICGRYFKNILIGLVFGLIGGVLIDLDHVLEYFLVYGFHFNLRYFLESRQFLISDKIRIYFHAWEYFFIFFGLAMIFKKRIKIKLIFIVLTFSITAHLISDVLINNYKFSHYSLIYRIKNNFSAPEILSPENYKLNQDYRIKLGI